MLDHELYRLPPPVSDVDGIARWANGVWFNHGGLVLAVGDAGRNMPTPLWADAVKWVRENAKAVTPP